MNERIKELTVQADNYAYKMNPEEDSYGRPANSRKFQQDRDTKFAELIVRECVNAADEWYQYHNEIQWDPGEHIKQHFGVE